MDLLEKAMIIFKQVIEKDNKYIIKNFPIVSFLSSLKKEYKTTKFKHLLTIAGIKLSKNKRTIVIHKFFIPELIYLLRKLGYPTKLINTIIENTWLNETGEASVNNRVNLSLIKKHMNLKLKSYQQEFIEKYDVLRQRHMLNGYLLSFDQGMGKTLTALALMQSLNKSKVIIIAPKSVLHTVWVDHIERFFKSKKVVYVSSDGKNIDINADYFIVNYEALGKLQEVIPKLASGSESVGIIVDESHNFLRIKSDRTQELIQLRKSLHCNDCLLLSGTPLKAVGIEMIPILMLLDNFFDMEALAIFKKAFGVNTTVANDVMHARLTIMMERKLKADGLDLPPKNEHTIKVAIPHGDNYTVSKVQEGMKIFAEERFKFHEDKMHEYLDQFREVMEWIKENSPIAKSEEFLRYLSEVEYLRSMTIDMRNTEISEKVQWVNIYERKVILPALPNDVKRKFKDCKSAVKYVHLKVRGEVIGQYLMRLRMEMTSAMVEHANLKEYIDGAIKKTVIFTSYIDTVKRTGDIVTKLGYDPIVLHSGAKMDAKKAVNMFNNDPNLNPLISSVSMLMTGVTMVVANTMIFLNKPFRYTDYVQASDRIHRIGQDTKVDVYTILLDTGAKGNLSTRMEEIMDWSKNQFSELVEDNT